MSTQSTIFILILHTYSNKNNIMKKKKKKNTQQNTFNSFHLLNVSQYICVRVAVTTTISWILMPCCFPHQTHYVTLACP